MKRIILFSGFLALFTGAIVAAYIYNKPHKSTDKAAFTIKADALIREFKKNENEANARYIDQVLEVEGTVKEVIQREHSFVLVLGDDSSMSSVSCTLSNGKDSLAYGLRTGDKILIRGICSGFLMDVILVNCRIISVP